MGDIQEFHSSILDQTQFVDCSDIMSPHILKDVVKAMAELAPSTSLFQTSEVKSLPSGKGLYLCS